MNVKLNVELPNFERTKNGRKTPPYIDALYDFCESSNSSILFECEERKEALCIRSTLGGRIKSDNLPLKVYLRGNDVYVTRKIIGE